MSKQDIIRAWKDPEYRLSLSEAERALLPQNPAGLMELSDEDLGEIGGAATWDPICLTIAVAVSLQWCSPNGTFCGTCSFGTRACCEPAIRV